MQKEKILEIFTENTNFFQLVEFGAGDGFKTKILLRHFLEANANFEYLPIDISANVLELLSDDLKRNLPTLKARPVQGDYFQVLKKLHQEEAKTRKAVLFLGSNIGNFRDNMAKRFLHEIAINFSQDDYLLIGFDLKKDPRTILKAYDDAKGITKAFNLNLLYRINAELGGNFRPEKFGHYATYDPVSGDTRSYLISHANQSVSIAGTLYKFDLWEPIFTELSKKYSIQDIETLAEATGFEVVTHLFDCKHYFVNSIWKRKG